MDIGHYQRFETGSWLDTLSRADFEEWYTEHMDEMKGMFPRVRSVPGSYEVYIHGRWRFQKLKASETVWLRSRSCQKFMTYFTTSIRTRLEEEKLNDVADKLDWNLTY